MEKKLDSNYTRMLKAVLNKLWRQHPTKQQLLNEPDMRDTAVEVRTNSGTLVDYILSPNVKCRYVNNVFASERELVLVSVADFSNTETRAPASAELASCLPTRRAM